MCVGEQGRHFVLCFIKITLTAVRRRETSEEAVVVIQGVLLVAWPTAVFGKADNEQEAGVAILMKRKAIGDCQAPSLGIERKPSHLSQACSGTCWPMAVRSQIMHRAGIQGWHSPRKFLPLHNHLHPYQIQRVPLLGPKPPSRVVTSCRCPASEPSHPGSLTTRQAVALSSVTLTASLSLALSLPQTTAGNENSFSNS